MVPHGFNIRALAPRVFALAAGAAFLATVHACSRPPLLAPSGTAITLVSSANVLPVNGSTDITAILIEGGQTTTTGGGGASNTTTNPGIGTPVHNGTTVTFSTSLGRIEPSEATTTNGQAVVKLIGDGRSGVATITAFSGAATKTLTVNIGAAGAARIAITADPNTLGPDGGSSIVTANVQDTQGNGLLGIPVSFTTDQGRLSVTSAISDQNGDAKTTLTTTATAKVTANSGAATGNTATTATVTVTVKARTSFTLTPPAAATVSVPAAFQVDTGSTSVPDITLDFGDGQKQPMGTVTGKASTTHLYANSGAFTVTATATDVDGLKTSQSTSVSVAPLTASAVSSPATTTLGNPVVITVTPSTGALIDHYEFDFNEGDPVTSTPSNSLSHVFKQRGTNQVNIKVVPKAGAAFTIFAQVPIT